MPPLRLKLDIMSKSTYTIKEVENIIAKAFNSGYQYAYYSNLVGKADVQTEVNKLVNKLLK